jgi:hypothetical protein
MYPLVYPLAGGGVADRADSRACAGREFESL